MSNGDEIRDRGPHTEKAYKNLQFLSSPDARIIRILSEFVEPESRFRRQRVRDTIVFFGSARILPREVAEQNLRALQGRANADGDVAADELRLALQRAERAFHMSRYYEEAAQLAEKLTHWARSVSNAANRFLICSGGGPGIMEAANLGAHRAGGHSVSLNISLPFEQQGNSYMTPELAFEFHYFFVRKFWFVYLAKALVVFPGGFGTCDELFELLTLVQTQKSAKYMPIVLYGTEFWKEVLNFEALAKWGMISPEDLGLFRFFDDVDSAFEFLRDELTKNYLKDSKPAAPMAPAEPGAGA
jgi:uncharacterized protein (TIGR00730 family)